MNIKRQAYSARWVLPISSPPIENGLVVVEGSRIVYVGDASRYQHVPQHMGQDSGPVPYVDATHSIIMPGFVNTHSHLELTAMRGLLEGLNFREWLRVLTEVRTTILDEQALVDSSIAGIHEGLLAGITTYADTNASGAPLTAMREMGVRGIGYLEVFGPSDMVADEALAGLKSRVNASREIDTELVKTGVSPHAPYTVSKTLFEKVGDLARENNLPVAIHLAESAAEYELIRHGLGTFADGLRSRGIKVRATNISPVQYLDSTGILDDTRSLLIHCIRVDEADLQTIAERGGRIAHCPISNAKLGHGIAPLNLMMRAGINVGLGTDSVASNNRMDILSEARMATLLQSVQQKLPDALSATNALRLATLGGAEALGLSDSIGSLEIGKQADIAMFEDYPHFLSPCFDPADTLVHAMGSAALVRTVLVAGRECVREGKVVHSDIGVVNRNFLLGQRLAQWRSQSR